MIIWNQPVSFPLRISHGLSRQWGFFETSKLIRGSGFLGVMAASLKETPAAVFASGRLQLETTNHWSVWHLTNKVWTISSGDKSFYLGQTQRQENLNFTQEKTNMNYIELE